MNYTDTDLDRIEREHPDIKVRPREREAGRKYLLIPEGERSYEAVATMLTKSDGSNPTVPRTAVYVREYLNAYDLIDEAPARGRRSANGGNGPTLQTVRNMPPMAEVISNAIEQYEAEISRVQELFADAKEEVANFDPEAYRSTVAEEFETKIAELQARLTAWVNDEGNVASESATNVLNDLTKRADALENEANSPKIENIKSQAEFGRTQLALMLEAQEKFEAALAGEQTGGGTATAAQAEAGETDSRTTVTE